MTGSPCFWKTWQFWRLWGSDIFEECPSNGVCLMFITIRLNLRVFVKKNTQVRCPLHITLHEGYQGYMVSLQTNGNVNFNYLAEFMFVKFLHFNWLPIPHSLLFESKSLNSHSRGWKFKLHLLGGRMYINYLGFFYMGDLSLLNLFT